MILTIATWLGLLDPVTVTLYRPTVEAIQERMEFPELPKRMDFGDRLHVNPVDGETATVSVTLPV